MASARDSTPLFWRCLALWRLNRRWTGRHMLPLWYIYTTVPNMTPLVFLHTFCCLAESPDCQLICCFPVLILQEQRPLVVTLKGSGSGWSMHIKWCKPGWREKEKPARSGTASRCEVLLCSLGIKCCCDRLGCKGRISWQTDGRKRFMWSLHNPMPRFLCSVSVALIVVERWRLCTGIFSYLWDLSQLPYPANPSLSSAKPQ